MLVAEEMSKGEARQRKRKEWALEVNAQEATGNIILKTPEEWYFP